MRGGTKIEAGSWLIFNAVAQWPKPNPAAAQAQTLSRSTVTRPPSPFPRDERHVSFQCLIQYFQLSTLLDILGS